MWLHFSEQLSIRSAVVRLVEGGAMSEALEPDLLWFKSDTGGELWMMGDPSEAATWCVRE